MFALSEYRLFGSPASLKAALCFPRDSYVVPPTAVAAPDGSVLATPAPSQLPPSWPVPLPQQGFRKRRKLQIRPKLYYLEIRE